jgi:MFS family permease
MASPGQTYGVSIFLDHIIADLGISRSLTSALFTMATLVGSATMPLVGRQIDRRGSRRTFTIISALFGLSCAYMGFVQNAPMLGIGFVTIRLFGQGALVLVSKTVINHWWVRRRGTILGIAGVFTGLLGIGAFPNLIDGMIPIWGWRLTYALLGLALLFVIAPLGFLFLRDQPEDYGLQPDGNGRQSATGRLVPSVQKAEHWTPREAIRTPAFWAVGLGCASVWMMSTGLYFHTVSILGDRNLSPSVAAAAFIPVALSAALLNLAGGALLDRLPVRLVMVAALVLQAVSLTTMRFVEGIELAFLYGIVQGAADGLCTAVINVVWATYFGRRHLGTIAGAGMMILSTGSALGAVPFGVARDLLGDYNLALAVATTLPLLLGVINLFVKRPRRCDYLRN